MMHVRSNAIHIENCNIHFENCNAPAERQRRGASKPHVDLWFELETECNIECRFCYNYWKDGRSPAPVRRDTADTLTALRRLLAVVDCRQFALSGGEPLLRPDLPAIVETVAAHGVPLILTTNGVLLTPASVEQLSRAGVRTFQISVHSHRPDQHDALTVTPSWHLAMKALASVRASCSDPVVVFVATRSNAGDFPAMIPLCSSLGVERIIFNRFVPTGAGALHADALGSLNDEELIDILNEADADASRRGIRIQLGVPISVPDDVRARWRSVDLASCPVGKGQHRWTLGADLRLRRCNHSAGTIGGVLEDGLDRLLAELSMDVAGAETGAAGINPCRLLESAAPLIQIMVPSWHH